MLLLYTKSRYKYTQAILDGDQLYIGRHRDLSKDIKDRNADMLNDYLIATASVGTTKGYIIDEFTFRYKMGLKDEYVKYHLKQYIISKYGKTVELINIIYY
jgi:hypothetical protein